MTDFTHTYLKGMGYDVLLSVDDQWIPCEICDRKATAVHHIDARGMGGTTHEYKVVDLMALCTPCHERHGDITDQKPLLRSIHRLRMYARRVYLATNRLMTA